MPLAMADVAEKSVQLALIGLSGALIGHVVRILISRGRNRGDQDARNLEREHGRAEQETKLRDDLMILVGELRSKETEQRRLIDVLEEQLRKAEHNLDKQRRAKHDIIGEVNHLSMTIQAYRMSPSGQIADDNVDLNRLADICKIGDDW